MVRSNFKKLIPYTQVYSTNANQFAFALTNEGNCEFQMEIALSKRTKKQISNQVSHESSLNDYMAVAIDRVIIRRKIEEFRAHSLANAKGIGVYLRCEVLRGKIVRRL